MRSSSNLLLAAGRLLPPLPKVGRMPYYWGMYALIPLIAYGFQPNPLPGFLWTLAAVVAVLGLFFSAFHLEGRAIVLVALAISGIGVALAPVNPNSVVFFTYSACCGARLPRLRDGLWLVGMNLVVIAAAAMQMYPHDPLFWFFGLFGTVATSVPAIYGVEAMRAKGRLLRKQEEVELLATLAERGRIARDLHDVLGHSLSVIVLKGQLLGRLLEQDVVRARAELADIEATARDGLQQLRRCVDGYRGAGLPLELLGAERVLSAAGVRLEIEGELASPPAAVENLMVLSLREIVTNVLRHSGATRCRIRLWADADGFGCEVTDDGVGLGRSNKGNGLHGMRERLEAMGGQLRLADLAPGTSVRLHVPGVVA